MNQARVLALSQADLTPTLALTLTLILMLTLAVAQALALTLTFCQAERLQKLYAGEREASNEVMQQGQS